MRKRESKIVRKRGEKRLHTLIPNKIYKAISIPYFSPTYPIPKDPPITPAIKAAKTIPVKNN